jgi:hypothetical protein
MKEEFMEKFGWSYGPERMWHGVKGYVAKNMAHVKGEIVKGLQKRGQASRPWKNNEEEERKR